MGKALDIETTREKRTNTNFVFRNWEKEHVTQRGGHSLNRGSETTVRTAPECLRTLLRRHENVLTVVVPLSQESEPSNLGSHMAEQLSVSDSCRARRWPARLEFRVHQGIDRWWAWGAGGNQLWKVLSRHASEPGLHAVDDMVTRRFGVCSSQRNL